MTSTPLLRIGTRGSPLALAQAHEVRDNLAAVHEALAAPSALEIVEIKTTGDVVLDRPLADVGGKGLFSKEIDTALLDGRIDIAVHSMKDLETWIAEGIHLAALLPREDPRDVIISGSGAGLDDLPEGALIGTASLRRQAQILHRRPDLQTELIRGNVQTRLRKLADGEVAATLLALAGLRRLGLEDKATQILEPEVLLPAVGQGAVGITCRSDDTVARDWLAAIDDSETTLRVSAERAMLDALDGSCRTPIGGFAQLDGSALCLRGLVARPDGSEIHVGERRGPTSEGVAMGRDLGAELKSRAGPDLFE